MAKIDRSVSQPIPVLPIRNTLLFPGTTVPLKIGRSKSIQAVLAAQKTGDDWVLAVTQKTERADGEVGAADLYSIGVLAKIEKLKGSPEAGYQALLRGVARFRVNEYVENSGLISAHGESLKNTSESDPATEQALLASVKQLALEILEMVDGGGGFSDLVEGIDELGFLIDVCAANLELDLEKKQGLLETLSLRDRGLKLLELMQKQKETLQVRSEIRDKLGQKMGKLQRESILREQLKTIREELGEESGGEGKDDYRAKIEKAGMPEETKKAALAELTRMEAMGQGSHETHVIRNYLDLLCALPWAKSSRELWDVDLEKARSGLEQGHYGLDKVKKRILQYLAVLKLKKSVRGQILLFVGPPGVGKTSLGESIASVLGRKFVRGSLGGVRDDAEIRGHRRTYVGAMPGRIIQAIKRAGENDPVFLLDEIDKLGRGYGDPASALLEVLDPEQNKTFVDHYLDVPFDLSKVFFIATANSLDTIPAPLLDRMEVIDLGGYTTAEKLHIAKNHLIPKQLAEHGLTKEQVEIADDALLSVIHSYTREAGVRDLQRKLATIYRTVAEKVLVPGAQLPVRVESTDLEEILGGERYVHEVAEIANPPGVATGLAWTPQGGEILFIESSLMPGKSHLTVTGQLGEVMKESTQIALSLVRSKLAHLIPDFDLEKKDIHVHVPAGAIPKDGPSAGITMLTSIASVLTGKRVDPKLAMTGEITLRGAVMPVGGIKEKVVAAHRAGITRVILSKRNQKDLKEVPEEVRQAMKFEFVENAEQVLKLALGVEFGSPDLTGDLTGLALPPQGPSGSAH